MRKCMRILAILFCLMLLVTGCGGNSKKKQKEDLKIAMLTSGSTEKDGGFNQNIYEGINDFIKDHPDCSVDTFCEESEIMEASQKLIEEKAKSYDVVVCCGYLFSSLASVANAHKDVDFLLMDSVPTNVSGETVMLDNVYSVSYAEQESGFAAGICAACESHTNKVALINGVPYPENVDYQLGFNAGVNYANKHYGTSANTVEIADYQGVGVKGRLVGGNYVGTFSNREIGKTLCRELLDEDCDVIALFAGESGIGALDEIKAKEGISCIGCDVDQYELGKAADSSVVITSSLKLLGKNAKDRLEVIFNNSAGGRNEEIGFKDKGVDYVKSGKTCLLTKETVEQVNDAIDRIKSGEISLPSYNNNYTPENFKGL